MGVLIYTIMYRLTSLFMSFYNSSSGYDVTEASVLNVTGFTTDISVVHKNSEDEARTIIGKFIGFIIFGFLTISGVVGNFLVIFVIKTDHSLNVATQLSNLPVLHLAYMDIITTGLVCGSAAISILFDEYPFGIIWCGVWSYWNLMGLIITIGLLTVISVDRFIAVGWSLHYPQLVTYERLLGGVAYVWISCLGIGFFWVSTEFEYEFWTGVCDIIWAHIGPDDLFQFIVAFENCFHYVIIPSSGILICNLLIIHFSKEKGHAVTMDDGSKGNKTESKANAKVLKAMIIVIVSFFALTFPSGFVKMLKILGGVDGPIQYVPNLIVGLTSVLQLSASIVNPLIYGLFRKDFRDAYARLWKKISNR